MGGRIKDFLLAAGRILREVGSNSRSGAGPAALVSKNGTYGTQRTESAELDEQRRSAYPRD